jgi:hypothetical protein
MHWSGSKNGTRKKIWNFEILRRGWKNKNPRKRV